MSVRMTSEVTDQAKIVNLSGTIFFHDGDSDVRRFFEAESLPLKQKKILMDFSGITRMDSSGIGAIAVGATHFMEEGGTIAFCGFSPRLRVLFRVTKLDTVLRILDDPKVVREFVGNSSCQLGLVDYKL